MDEVLKDSLLLKVLENVSDGAYCIDPERKILYWNERSEQITGYHEKEVLGTRCWDNILKHVDDRGTELCLNRCPLVKAMGERNVQKAEVFLHHRDGYRLPVVVVGIPVVNEAGEVVGAIELFRERTERSFLESEVRELRKLAFVDELTGVLNRRGLEYYLKMKLNEVDRFKRIIAVLFIDVDKFKQINDHYGHDVGDKVLRFVAMTLKKNVRASDLVAGVGGDEFVAVLELKEDQEVVEVAERLRTLISESFIVENGEIIRVTASVGGVVVKEHRDMNEILKLATSYSMRARRKVGMIAL
ncbi:MAG: Diguanylate cyclase with PAS/PAC sensor [Thermotoga sp. 50_1627]|uniref:sensor domain-containing diguanylate cyclase n=1 Tax=Pseudothermotoga sp. TaxID=2033661 RepID=UPI00076DA53D|nr:MAG: Diguanylate cyclase with PAS/PAC sensor [Thermotoga sp. 50_64]KUK25468.1 MAG: Diguanylate cyclase with PAS/PAC sensor [Thermotoga sp. 50_1627]MDK2922959.1 two-component system, cell cycle response regulator [Pseudothermotoga sp.]